VSCYILFDFMQRRSRQLSLIGKDIT